MSIDPEGCVGHSKAIMALVMNMLVSGLDINCLHSAKCVRSKFCSMNLASCAESITAGKI